ncbi:MAG: pyridoxal phosphate-dependent aminotransferase [Candidatus Muiribacteriota bacterium]
MFSKIAMGIGESETIKVADIARKLREEGKDIISFAVGEPDFDTPEIIKTAGKDAIDSGFTKYTDLKGIKKLRNKICQKLKRDNNLTYTDDEIVVSNGAKHALFNALCALVNPGEEVLIVAPAWVSYVEQVKLIGAKPVILNSPDDLSMPVEEIKNNINSNTKAIMINSPSNPTGKVYTEDELKALAEIVLQHENLYVISDEIYEKIIHKPSVHVSIASLSPEIKDRTVVINGFSKAYAMTGWRMGYSASNIQIAKLIAKIQSHMTSCPCSISQYACLEAVELDEQEITKMVTKFEQRRKILEDFFDKKPELKYTKPDGAFYFFVDFSPYIGKKVKNSMELSMYLMEKAHIAVTAGSAFFKENYIRISYATSEKNIREGLSRLDKALKELNE